MSYLSLRRLTKSFGAIPAVRDLSLEIERGEFVALLGPSGCGKSTLLRLIAGLETPSSGEIVLGGRDLARLTPRERGIGLVFQNYALFPHMTVEENVAYGLEGRRIPRGEIADRVTRMLRSVGLEGKRTESVTTLSGGEQQRVAVARAVVVEPAVLLFDEPLSNLDVALRQQTREEIRALQRRTGITTVYVTHDQGEALTLADRIGVMRAGRLEQAGSPEELYDRPATAFVARFLGGANLLRPDQGIPFPAGLLAQMHPGDVVALKPEAIRIGGTSETSSGAPVEGTVIEREYLGFTTQLLIRAGETELRVLAVTAELPPGGRPGERVGCIVDWKRAVLCPPE